MGMKRNLGQSFINLFSELGDGLLKKAYNLSFKLQGNQSHEVLNFCISCCLKVLQVLVKLFLNVG